MLVYTAAQPKDCICTTRCKLNSEEKTSLITLKQSAQIVIEMLSQSCLFFRKENFKTFNARKDSCGQCIEARRVLQRRLVR